METEENLTPNTPPTTQMEKLPNGSTRLRVQFDITYRGTEGTSDDGISLTEPDMSMTVRQMLQQASGIQPSQQKQPIYFETSVPTFRDFTDIDRYKDELTERLDNVNTFIKSEQAQKQAEQEAKAQAAKDTEAAKAQAQREPK